MISEAFLLALIGLVSYLYNLLIYPYIILLISVNIYNNILIYILIILQIDNFSLLHELNAYKKEDNDKMDERYIRIISGQIAYICNKQNEINKMTKAANNRKLHDRSRSF